MNQHQFGKPAHKCANRFDHKPYTNNQHAPGVLPCSFCKSRPTWRSIFGRIHTSLTFLRKRAVNRRDRLITLSCAEIPRSGIWPDSFLDDASMHARTRSAVRPAGSLGVAGGQNRRQHAASHDISLLVTNIPVGLPVNMPALRPRVRYAGFPGVLRGFAFTPIRHTPCRFLAISTSPGVWEALRMNRGGVLWGHRSPIGMG